MTKSFLKGLVAAAVGIALLAAPAAAQIGWSLGAGLTMPQGDFGDGAESGFHGMAGATFSIPAAPIKIRADFGYHMLPASEDLVGDADVSFNMITVSGDAQWTIMPGPLSPYLVGGLTWGSMGVGGDDAPDVDAETDMGFNIGGGLDFGLAALKLFAEARYFSVGDADFLPITVGLRF
ncbi:MAG TPA: outer membrane beta-barrel protein [Solirubrobacterales bacterium]|jgi:opacity protein-like surface antigen